MLLLDKEHDSQLWLVLKYCRPWASPGPQAGNGVPLPSPVISYLCLISGAEKRGFARTRNNSDSARTPQNFSRKRQLSESQTETMNNSDSRINPRQLGTPRGIKAECIHASGISRLEACGQCYTIKRWAGMNALNAEMSCKSLSIICKVWLFHVFGAVKLGASISGQTVLRSSTLNTSPLYRCC